MLVKALESKQNSDDELVSAVSQKNAALVFDLFANLVVWVSITSTVKVR